MIKMITYLLLLSVSSILIPPYQAEEACRMMIDKHNRAEMMSRNFVFGNNNLWPDKQVPYVFGTRFTSSEKRMIQEAMDTIQTSSCVEFIARSTQRNFIILRNDKRGCYTSALGFNQNRGSTTINLNRRMCMTPSTIIHELFHALGFMHEQNRPDRDAFIRVSWNNIQQSTNTFYQFARARASGETIQRCDLRRLTPYSNCYNGMTATTFGLPYDYKSVMQYSRTAFSKNGRNTMTPTRAFRGPLGNRVGMTSLDIQKLNEAYQCNSATSCNDGFSFCSNVQIFCRLSTWMRKNCKKTCNFC
ncbi:hatching enzyme 1.2 [Lepeophtheirus salmonis]|uniref:hatching enzyme 1.2 n=1 Tax=Lepeophtheirus salmonis TaxID=72036 RepID=UPI001AE8421E|nr:high choriolytic enzyme 1-like [Lepeophtheirus salmonis]